MRKPLVEFCSKHDFHAILAFLTKYCFFCSLPKIFFSYQKKKVFFFLPFSQKLSFLVKFDIKKGFSNSFPFKMFTLTYSMLSYSLKVQHSPFFKISGLTPTSSHNVWSTQLTGSADQSCDHVVMHKTAPLIYLTSYGGGRCIKCKC